MQTTFILVALVSFVPSEVFSNGTLQDISDIVRPLNTTRMCDYDFEPKVNVDGTNLTISFRTTIADGVDTKALCKCIQGYIKETVSDAKSDCVVEMNQFKIAFHGEYDPNVKPLPTFTKLAQLLTNYEQPDFGGYKCSREISKRDGRIYITLTYSGEEYKSACAGILRYLNQNDFLNGSSNKCTEIDSQKTAVLDLWANE